MSSKHRYPTAVDPKKVETYRALAKAGGGFVWDEVLEYRVWCHPERGAPDLHDGDAHGSRERNACRWAEACRVRMSALTADRHHRTLSLQEIGASW